MQWLYDSEIHLFTLRDSKSIIVKVKHSLMLKKATQGIKRLFLLKNPCYLVNILQILLKLYVNFWPQLHMTQLYKRTASHQLLMVLLTAGSNPIFPLHRRVVHWSRCVQTTKHFHQLSGNLFPNPGYVRCVVWSQNVRMIRCSLLIIIHLSFLWSTFCFILKCTHESYYMQHTYTVSVTCMHLNYIQVPKS